MVKTPPMPTTDSFKARATVKLAGKDYDIWRLDALAKVGDVATLPFSIRILARIGWILSISTPRTGLTRSNSRWRRAIV